MIGVFICCLISFVLHKTKMADLYNTIDPNDSDMSTLIGRGKSQRLVDMTTRTASSSVGDGNFVPRPVRLSGVVTSPAQSKQQNRTLPVRPPAPYTQINQSPIMKSNPSPAIVSRVAATASGSGGMKWWEIALIVVAAVVLVAGAAYYMKKKKARQLTLTGGAAAAAADFYEAMRGGYI